MSKLKQYNAKVKTLLTEPFPTEVMLSLLDDGFTIGSHSYPKDKMSYEFTLKITGPDDGRKLSADNIKKRIEGYPIVNTVEVLSIEE